MNTIGIGMWAPPPPAPFPEKTATVKGSLFQLTPDFTFFSLFSKLSYERYTKHDQNKKEHLSSV